jgi:phage N-6-adenine-methyltransferase
MQAKLYYTVLLKDMWRTPDEIFKPLHDEFRFTLDPCCEIGTSKCLQFFTPDDDGLKQHWAFQRVFCNPPYSRGNIDKWVEKCYYESEFNGALVVALLPVSTSSKWFHNYIWKVADIRFIKGRVKFVGAESTAPFSSMIVIWHPKQKLKI